jgi:uncharacterized protein
VVKDKRIKGIIAEVVEKIKNEYRPDKIILFGSYAYGTPTEDSDIDLFIIKNTGKRRIDRFVEVSPLVENPRYHIPISPLVYTPDEVAARLAIGDQFVEEVLNKGEVLYAR